MSSLPELDSIDTQIQALQKKKQDILDAKRTEALQQAKELVRTFGFTAKDLELVGPAKASGEAGTKSKLPAKYRNPNNPAEDWHGGQGPKPKWGRAPPSSRGAPATTLLWE